MDRRKPSDCLVSLESYKQWNVLQGLPLRHDFYTCELLAAYRCGVQVYNRAECHEKEYDLKCVLHKIQTSLLRLISVGDPDPLNSGEDVLDGLYKVMLKCVQALEKDYIIPYSLLVILVAVIMTCKAQSQKAQFLVDTLLTVIDRFKDANGLWEFTMEFNGGQLKLSSISDMMPNESDSSVDVPSVSLKDIALTLQIYLCVSRNDAQTCLSLLDNIKKSSILNGASSMAYVQAWIHTSQGQHKDAGIFLDNWMKEYSTSVTPEMWNICGVLCSQEGKHSTAIQCYKEALKMDFNYLLAIYNISLIYRKLKQFDTELEMLNFIVTNLQQTANHMLESSLSIFVSSTGQVITGDPVYNPVITKEQALYRLCKRCSELTRYDVAADKYLQLLASLSGMKPNKLAVLSPLPLPPITQIYIEAAQSLHLAAQYEKSLLVCDQVITHSTSSSNKQGDLDMDLLESSTECSYETPKKRPLDEADVDIGGVSVKVLAMMCKAQNLFKMSMFTDCQDCLESVIDLLQNAVISGDDVSSGTAEPLSKRSRIDSGGAFVPMDSTKDDSRMPHKILSKVYSMMSLVSCALCQPQKALKFSRKAVLCSNDDMVFVYNHCLLLLSMGGQQEAYKCWLTHRGISTPLDPLHGENMLSKRRTALQSQDPIATEDLFLPDLHDCHLLNLDVLALSYYLRGRMHRNL